MNQNHLNVRLLLVDDEEIILQGLKGLLSTEPTITVIGEARNGHQALEQAAKLQPDVVLMDLRMPFMGGIEAAGLIRAQFPATRVLMLSSVEGDEQIAQAVRQGADGYLLKNTPLPEITRSIHAVHQGYMQFGPGLGQRMMQRLVAPPPIESPAWTQLTQREQEVAQLIARGATNHEIATQLLIADKTVKNHVSNILSRLGMRDRTQVAVWVTQALGSQFQPVS